MREIKPIICSVDMKHFARISFYAYPGMSSSYDKLLETLQEINSKDKNSMFYVVKDEQKTVGGMRLIDYKMNYRNKFINVCGVGVVAVDLAHKKMGVAKDLIKFYLNKCRNDKQPIAILYPFRPDFYYNMGFGYGTPYLTYSFKPHSLTNTKDRTGWCYLAKEDMPLIADCYKRVAQKQHGFCLRSSFELERYKKRFEGNGVTIGYKENGRVEGYLYFTSKKSSATNFLTNYIKIHEFVYTTPKAMQALCNFLYIQSDQYDRIEYETQQHDFHYALSDVRYTDQDISPRIAHKAYVGGLGMMYRIVDVKMWFELLAAKYTFNCADMSLAITVEDSFMPTNNGTYYLNITSKKMKLEDKTDNQIALTVNITELSSLMMGSVRFENLYRVGKAKCDQQNVEILSDFFNIPSTPQCLTSF